MVELGWVVKIDATDHVTVMTLGGGPLRSGSNVDGR